MAAGAGAFRRRAGPGHLPEAHVLVRRVSAERGYPTQGLDSQTDLVSVDHPEVVGDYRGGRPPDPGR